MTQASSWHQGWAGSIRVRIVAAVILLLLLAEAGSVLLLRTVLFERLEDEVTQSLSREAQEFKFLSRGSDPRTGEPFGTDIEALFDVYFSRELPDEGETLMTFVDGRLYESRRAQDAADPGEIQDAVNYWLSLDEEERGQIDTAFGAARYVAVPVDRGRREGLLVVANFPSFERSEIDDAVQAQVLVQVATFVVAALLAMALAGRILRPLTALASTARNITDTDLTQRIAVTRRDEASQIAETFNEMIARLERAFLTQRQFLDDTSHELRSPLTVIRGHVELLEFDSTPEERSETIALVLDEVDRLTRMVHDLSVLARAEQPHFLTVGPLDLREVLLEVHRKVVTLAPRDWQVREDGPVTVTGDRYRLTQAVMQLTENAVKHTGEGATIQLGVTARGSEAVVWVQDSGSGVPPEEAEQVFERFHRGRDDAGVSGGGLGLAIVRAIAEAHDGTAVCVPRTGGARFEVALPRASSNGAHPGPR